MPTLVHPYEDFSRGQWLRGNLHTHTTRSDGAAAPQAVIDAYAKLGYDFLALSDHDVFSHAPEHAPTDPRGLLMLPGNEVTANGPHMLHIGGDRKVEPSAQRQQTLDTITAGPGFAVVNHPNWQDNFDHCPIESMRAWNGYVGMEIYNGVICRLTGSPYADDKWDMLLTEGRRLWAFANDDMHDPSKDLQLGWNMVLARERSVAGVLDALRAGRFYPSTGVAIRSIEVAGDRVRIEAPDAHRIVASTNGGKRFAVADAPTLEVAAPAGAKYIRFTCWGAGERFAWTQPFWLA